MRSPTFPVSKPIGGAPAHTHPHPVIVPKPYRLYTFTNKAVGALLGDIDEWALDLSYEAPFAEKFVQESARIEQQFIAAEYIKDSMHLMAYNDMLASAEGDAPLSASAIKEWQRLIAGEQHSWGDRYLGNEDLGQYRKHAIFISFSRETGGPLNIGSEQENIEQDMDDLLAMVNAAGAAVPSDNDDLLARAALIHWRYERIHPFADGNGRSGRLLALWYLRRHNAPPVLFTHMDKAATYYPCFSKKTPEMMEAYFEEHLLRDWE